MHVEKITQLKVVDFNVVRKCFIQLRARFSSCQEDLINHRLTRWKQYYHC